MKQRDTWNDEVMETAGVTSVCRVCGGNATTYVAWCDACVQATLEDQAREDRATVRPQVFTA